MYVRLEKRGWYDFAESHMVYLGSTSYSDEREIADMLVVFMMH